MYLRLCSFCFRNASTIQLTLITLKSLDFQNAQCLYSERIKSAWASTSAIPRRIGRKWNYDAAPYLTFLTELDGPRKTHISPLTCYISSHTFLACHRTVLIYSNSAAIKDFTFATVPYAMAMTHPCLG